MKKPCFGWSSTVNQMGSGGLLPSLPRTVTVMASSATAWTVSPPVRSKATAGRFVPGALMFTNCCFTSELLPERSRADQST